MSYRGNRVAVVIPAHNEQNSIGRVVSELAELQLGDKPLIDDIVVCDNQSTDDTAIVAERAGARVVHESIKGYGAACLRAMRALRGDGREAPQVVVFVDGDYSARTDEVVHLLAKLSNGSDLVVGSRGNVLLHKGALSPHQRFGNFLASTLINFIWKKDVSDLGPFRVIRYSRLLELDMQDQKFGWTVEMQVKAIQAGFNYAEVPVTTRPRIGVSKISGTLRGTIGAAIGIFGKIFQLYLHEREFVESVNQGRSVSKLEQS